MGISINTLQEIPLFRHLAENELKRVRDASIRRTYHKKEVIFVEGSEKKTIYFITDGLIKAYKTDKNGQEHIISFLQSGEMFPHTGLFNDRPNPATTVAIVHTEIIALPLDSFEELITAIPDLAAAALNLMTDKIVELQEKLQQITSYTVQDRGHSFLIKLAKNYGITKNNHIYIHFPMTHQDIANAIGTTRESVSRFLNELRKEKLIETMRDGFVIRDLQAFKNWNNK